MSETEHSESVWGDARDIGIMSVALLTFAGLVYFHYYLAAFGIGTESIELASPNILVFSIALLVRHILTIVLALIVITVLLSTAVAAASLRETVRLVSLDPPK